MERVIIMDWSIISNGFEKMFLFEKFFQFLKQIHGTPPPIVSFIYNHMTIQRQTSN